MNQSILVIKLWDYGTLIVYVCSIQLMGHSELELDASLSDVTYYTLCLVYIYTVYNNIDARYSIIVFNYIFIAKFQLVVKFLILDVKDNLLLLAE